MTISARPLPNDLEACRQELRAAIEWFKRMRDGWRRTPGTGDSRVERAPEGAAPANGATRAHVEAPVPKAPATEPPGAGKVGEQRSTALEPAKESPRRGVLAWLQRTLSRLAGRVWKNPIAVAVAPIATYFVVGGLVCHVMR